MARYALLGAAKTVGWSLSREEPSEGHFRDRSLGQSGKNRNRQISRRKGGNEFGGKKTE